jgi:hypothetical protein
MLKPLRTSLAPVRGGGQALVFSPPDSTTVLDIAHRVNYTLLLNGQVWKQGVFTRDFKAKRNCIAWMGGLSVGSVGTFATGVITANPVVGLIGLMATFFSWAQFARGLNDKNDTWRHEEVTADEPQQPKAARTQPVAMQELGIPLLQISTETPGGTEANQ